MGLGGGGVVQGLLDHKAVSKAELSPPASVVSMLTLTQATFSWLPGDKGGEQMGREASMGWLCWARISMCQG